MNRFPGGLPPTSPLVVPSLPVAGALPPAAAVPVPAGLLPSPVASPGVVPAFAATNPAITGREAVPPVVLGNLEVLEQSGGSILPEAGADGGLKELVRLDAPRDPPPEGRLGEVLLGGLRVPVGAEQLVQGVLVRLHPV